MNYESATNSFPASRGRGRAAILPAWMTDPVLAKEARCSLTNQTSTEPCNSSCKNNLQDCSESNKTQHVEKNDSCIVGREPPNANVDLEEKHCSTSGSSGMRTTSSYDSNTKIASKNTILPNSVPTSSKKKDIHVSPPIKHSPYSPTLPTSSEKPTEYATGQLDLKTHKKDFIPPDRKHSNSITSSRDHEINYSKTSQPYSNTSRGVSSPYHEDSCYCGKKSNQRQCDCSLKLRDHHHVKKKRSRSYIRDSDSCKRRSDTYKKPSRQSLPRANDVHVADMLCEDLLQMCNSKSFRKLTDLLVNFRENVNLETFIFEDIDGRSGSWRSFEKYWLCEKRLDLSVEITHRVSIEASKTTSYVLQLEWMIPFKSSGSPNEKSSSHFALYECRGKKLTRCFHFQNSLKDYMKKKMSFTFRRLREERLWNSVVKYILKKGYKPTINCVFWDFIENKNIAEPLVLN